MKFAKKLCPARGKCFGNRSLFNDPVTFATGRFEIKKKSIPFLVILFLSRKFDKVKRERKCQHLSTQLHVSVFNPEFSSLIREFCLVFCCLLCNMYTYRHDLFYFLLNFTLLACKLLIRAIKSRKSISIQNSYLRDLWVQVVSKIVMRSSRLN